MTLETRLSEMDNVDKQAAKALIPALKQAGYPGILRTLRVLVEIEDNAYKVAKALERMAAADYGDLYCEHEIDFVIGENDDEIHASGYLLLVHGSPYAFLSEGQRMLQIGDGLWGAPPDDIAYVTLTQSAYYASYDAVVSNDSDEVWHADDQEWIPEDEA